MIKSSINLVKMNIYTYIRVVYSVFIEIMKAKHAKTNKNLSSYYLSVMQGNTNVSFKRKA